MHEISRKVRHSYLEVNRHLTLRWLIASILAILVAACSTTAPRSERSAVSAQGSVRLDTTGRLGQPVDSLVPATAIGDTALTDAVAEAVAAVIPTSDTLVAIIDSTLTKLDSLGVVDSLSLSKLSNALQHDTLSMDSLAERILNDSTRFLIVRGDTVYLGRSGHTGVDTLKIDSSKQSKNALDAPVDFKAKDSITFDYLLNRVNFYGDAKVNYQNLELSSNLISMSVDSSIVHAYGTRDSLGNMVVPPTFKQGEDTYEPDDIAYNFKTRKAFTHNVFTEQGEGYMTSQESKRDSAGTMYVAHAK